MNLQLHTFYRSSAAFRVRIALHYKNLAFEAIPVNLKGQPGDQFSSDFLLKNPAGMVPVLNTGHVHLHQSMAILEYLEEVYPEPALLPQDSIARAQVRALCHDMASDVHPLTNLRVLRYLKRELQVSANGLDTWYAHWHHLALAAYEQRLTDCAGQYSFADEISLADVCLVPQVRNAIAAQIPLERYPQIMRIYDKLMQNAAFKAASWEAQKDYVGA